MYLKEIKASGFKSFADPMNIALSDDITAIVGPNGSGKSNIVDAVKWVLGEQSVKTLRGSNNMTDVIFSGSKSRNPMNLASVTLIFDNTDNYLNVPYSEISVTRKVYRSGENEYYLNNEKCRLKDINDLFLDSGIGKYAFNIISQGEVANIINSSAYERRALFEEAAGVLKYKKRKEEALRKLDRTNENIVRIKDIIAELDRGIGPLKEQKEKAEKYLEYKNRLEGVEVALIVSDLEKLNIEFKTSEEKIKKLENEIANLLATSSTSDVKLEEEKNNLLKLNSEISILNEKYISLTKELERLNGEKNIVNERSKYESTDIKVHENITNLKEKTLILETEIKSLEDSLSIINDKQKELDKELESINDTHFDKLSKVKQLELEISEKSKKIIETQYKIKSLTDYIEQGGGASVSVKKVLSNLSLTGVHNTISNLIELKDDTHLTALTVAMGGAKDYVVVDTPEVAKKAINYLKENNLGRVTFYPLSVIKPRFIDSESLNIIKSCTGFIDTLDNILSFDLKYENIVKNVLGNVLLVDTLDNANIIRDKINNRYRIVTLSGEVINVGGSITGGHIKTTSVISERHELASLKVLNENLEKEVNDLNEKLKEELSSSKDFESNTFESEKKKVSLFEEKTSKEKEITSKKEELDKVRLELSNLEGLDTLKDEETKIMEKYYEVLSEKEKIEKDLSVANENKNKISLIIEELEASYRMSSSNIRNLEADLKKEELTNSRASVKMDNLLNVLSENYNMTYEKARDNYILDAPEKQARQIVVEAKRKLAELGEVNTLAIEEYNRVSTRYSFLTKQNEDLEKAIVELLKIIDELDGVMKSEFLRLFKEVQIEFNKVFKQLFGGGEARLELTDKDNLLETGINIIVTPPGKKLSSINLLSGGEKTLTAISLLFSILNLKDIPFCLFDEVEAALDEANVDRFGSYLKKYSGKTQLIIITHKKKTMEYANTLYGITMQESGVSKLVSVKLVEQ